MSAPSRNGQGGSRRLALRQRCCLDAPSANVGPLAGIAGDDPCSAWTWRSGFDLFPCLQGMTRSCWRSAPSGSNVPLLAGDDPKSLVFCTSRVERSLACRGWTGGRSAARSRFCARPFRLSRRNLTTPIARSEQTAPGPEKPPGLVRQRPERPGGIIQPGGGFRSLMAYRSDGNGPSSRAGPGPRRQVSPPGGSGSSIRPSPTPKQRGIAPAPGESDRRSGERSPVDGVSRERRYRGLSSTAGGDLPARRCKIFSRLRRPPAPADCRPETRR